MKVPEELIEQAVLLGKSTQYVQGAGGNLSIKSGNTIWIKASGTRLRDAAKCNIFIPMNLMETKKAVLETENLQACCIDIESNNLQNLRPSIETAIHSLLPQRHVAHVHALGSIATAISGDAENLVANLSINALKVFIPYAKPGIPLANLILDSISEFNIDSQANILILLGNHGLIVATKDSKTATDLIVEIESKLNLDVHIPLIMGLSEDGWTEVFPAKTVSPAKAELLLGGPLTPDEIVFLGERPFVKWENRRSDSKVAVKFDGSIWAVSDLSQDALEILESFVNIAHLYNYENEVSYLSSENVEELLNWDAEKWRKRQER